ncbi:uncharacterized protein F5891DRAFT_1197558 [Suillus fuscotomentosus]|uniref:Uncharacterized protein n=1 Tax=Suillus fuscotomentosus TaxID=1912939 RepID=A0AAD4DRH5_9AGAM|nr:uncharacterized protein F5891DRAFT_1197558 [Suillus fuscotomentosus]KAG1891710.1 hypothetical protein F5891DRAFT_1197558 [Suillus fuscotomentosus]
MSTPSLSLVVSQAMAILAGNTSGIIFATYKKQAKNTFPSLKICPTNTFSIISWKVLAINQLSDPDTGEDGAHPGSGFDPWVVKLEIHLCLNSNLGKHPQPVAVLQGVNITTDESGVTTVGQVMATMLPALNRCLQLTEDKGSCPSQNTSTSKSWSSAANCIHLEDMKVAMDEWLSDHSDVIAKWREFAHASQAAVLAWPIFILVHEALVPLIAEVGGDRGSKDRKYLRDALKTHGIGNPQLRAATLIIEAEDLLENCHLNHVKAAVDILLCTPLSSELNYLECEDAGVYSRSMIPAGAGLQYQKLLRFSPHMNTIRPDRNDQPCDPLDFSAPLPLPTWELKTCSVQFLKV